MNNINGIGLVGDSSTWNANNTNDAINSAANLTNSIMTSVNNAKASKYEYESAKAQAEADKQTSMNNLTAKQLEAETSKDTNETLRYQANVELQKAQIAADAQIKAAQAAASGNTSEGGNTKTYLIIGGVSLALIAGVATVVALTRK